MLSRALVFFQFLFLFLLFFPSKIHHLWGIVIFLFASLIGFIAVKTHPKGNFNIRPDIKENCTLITHGIYSYIRHPMYLSVILMGLGMAIFYDNFFKCVIFIFLVIVMLIKMFYEEKLWSKNECYKEYMKKTKRLIPFIF